MYDIPLEAIQDQLEVVKEDFTISAVKTGVLFNADITTLVTRFLKTADFGPLVIDPVMIAKSGYVLLKESAVKALIEELLPQAYIITPNIPEAEVITNMRISTKNDSSSGCEKYCCQRGHNFEVEQSSDLLLLEDGQIEWLSTPRINTKNTHDTGCTQQN